MSDTAREAAPGSAVDTPTDSERWRAARRYLNGHRRELAAVAAELYPELVHVAGTPLLARPEWIPSEPVALDAIDVGWQPDARRRG